MDCPRWRPSKKNKTQEFDDGKDEYMPWGLVDGIRVTKRCRRRNQEPNMGRLKVKIFFTAEELLDAGMPRLGH